MQETQEAMWLISPSVRDGVLYFSIHFHTCALYISIHLQFIEQKPGSQAEVGFTQRHRFTMNDAKSLHILGESTIN